MLKKFFAFVAALAVSGYAVAVNAAADTGFATATEAIELVWTDNSGNIWAWVAVAIGVSLLLALGIRALLFGKRQVIGAVPGGKRRR